VTFKSGFPGLLVSGIFFKNLFVGVDDMWRVVCVWWCVCVCVNVVRECDRERMEKGAGSERDWEEETEGERAL